MSRVRKPNKYVNSTKYDSSITNISKKTRIHFDGEDYHNAKTLSQWLFLKYDMTYKTFKNRRRKNFRCGVVYGRQRFGKINVRFRCVGSVFGRNSRLLERGKNVKARR